MKTHALTFFFLAFFIFIAPLQAQIPAAQNAETTSNERSLKKHEYAQPTIENFAKLYWALSKLDLENNEHVDNFLRITECEVFSNYRSNEFEWKDIRSVIRETIKDQKSTYPLRFELVLPLQLGNYNIEQQAFQLAPEDKIVKTGRFELITDTFGTKVCGIVRDIPYFPQGVIIDISRPLTLTEIPFPKDRAREMVTKINEEFKKLPSYLQTKEGMRQLREVTLVLNMKIYLYNETIKMTDTRERAVVTGVLEGLDIYRDPSREEIMYSEIMTRKKEIAGLELELIKEYEALKKKRGENVPKDVKAN